MLTSQTSFTTGGARPAPGTSAKLERTHRRARVRLPDVYRSRTRYILRMVARDDGFFVDSPDPEDDPSMAGFKAECPPAEDRIWRHPSEIRMTDAARPRRARFRLRPGHSRVPADRPKSLPAAPGAHLTSDAWSSATYGGYRPSLGFAQPGTPPRRRQGIPTIVIVALATAAASTAAVVGFHLVEPGSNAHAQSAYDLAGAATSSPLGARGAGAHAVKGAPLARIASVEAGPSVLDTIAELRAASVRITSVRRGAAVQGAGLVIRPNGLIITTSQLVAGAKRITVVTPTGQKRPAVLVGADASSDVAVIRPLGNGIKFHALPAAQGAATPTHVGELTIAVAPGGTGGEMVAIGVVRSAGHHARVAPGTALINAITTDAPLGNGAQGGALINGAGQLIGVIAASGSNTLGHGTTSIPAPLALGVANELATTGRVVHGWLGIEAADATPDAFRDANRSIEGRTPAADLGGAKVTVVEPSSSAQQAGIRPGDIIAMLNGQTISSMAELKSDLYLMPPYTKVVIGVVRAGQSAPIILNAVLAPSPT